MRKPTICICENKDADQLCSNCTADQLLCFRHMDSTIPLLRISKISSFCLYAVIVQPGLCWTWSETQIVGFRTHMLIFTALSTVLCHCVFKSLFLYCFPVCFYWKRQIIEFNVNRARHFFVQKCRANA